MKGIQKHHIFLALFLVMAMLLVLTSCAMPTKEGDVWETATFTEDAEFGNGSKTVMVEVQAQEKSVIFTVHTDKENLADALLEYDLIAGEQSPYGLYIKLVNGMLADYDVNQSYWSLCKEGQVLQTGASMVSVFDGERYELIYVKQ